MINGPMDTEAAAESEEEEGGRIRHCFRLSL